MATTILIPTPLRPYTDKHASLQLEGRTVGELLGNLATQYGDLRKHLYTDDGRLRNFVNVYVNDEDIRYLAKEATPLKAGDTVSIIPSVAGGSGSATALDELPTLSRDEFNRYSRHLLLPEVGVDGQRRLKAAKVLCIGAGGLGSPAVLYLAAAGVGTIGIVDFDVVDESNLQRQILHGTPDVGRPKLASAARRVAALNPNVTVVPHEVALSSKNALDIIRDYDIVLDGTDNFPTRYLVNDACVLLGKPNAYGSIFRFEGQASVFATADGPCYRCLYPEPPPPGLVPSCAEGGVLGVLPGIIGTIQATEAIKIVLGAGSPLVGRFLVFDALDMKFRELRVRKDPDCPVCGTHPTVRSLIDYERFCGLPAATTASAAPSLPSTLEISVEELRERFERRDAFYLLDVREPHEAEICRIDGATLIPLGQLGSRIAEVPRDREVVVHCKGGVRSAKAVSLLLEQGFASPKNVKGGIIAWVERIDPSQPKY
ncbi:MAG: molybdopterin-synthase adenylyltransferase MoeB [Vicinamibacterales bacterium]